MESKKFIAYIYLKCGKIVTDANATTVVSEDPVSFAKMIADNNVDEILIHDLSANDAEHDEAIGIIKQICLSCEIPVIGTGHIFRMEDVKKLLYAGCLKAMINCSSETEFTILDEVSHKFGKDKMIGFVANAADYTANADTINNLCSMILASDMKCAEELVKCASIPVIAMLPDMKIDALCNVMRADLCGGVSGDYVRCNLKEITAIKHHCFEQGIDINTFEGADDWSTFKLDSNGLLPVVVQDYKTNEVLQVAYMNEQAYHDTLRTGKMNYYSRSRQTQWLKGETSGHFQYVKSLTVDCDRDTMLAKVSQVGAACHTGSYSCFFNEIAKKEYDETNPLKVFEDVFNVILDRKIHPKEGSYTNYLFDKGIDKILKKLGEECTEIVIAAKNPNPDEIKYEISDFLYHMMVLMADRGVTWEEITAELARR